MDDVQGDAAVEMAGERQDGLGAAIEAILLTSDRPVAAQRLAEALGLAAAEPEAGSEGETAPEGGKSRRKKGRAEEGSGQAGAKERIEQAVEGLNREYAAGGRSFRIEQVAGGYRLMTLPEFAPVLAAYHRTKVNNRLSRAAIETLAIIAYKQPLTRAHLESIRGVSCGEVLRSLLERRLVTVTGRAEELGRPMLYGTTREFLDAFGLASLKDLPTATELQVTP